MKSYTVHYHEDDAIQSNVREALIRATEKTKKKKKSTKKTKTTPKKKQIVDDEMEVAATPTQKKRGRPSGNKAKNQITKKSKIADEEEEIPIAYFAAAKEMGFPEGWSAEDRGNDKWTFKSPDGKTYKSKKTAFSAACLDTPSGQKKKRGRPKNHGVDEIGEAELIGIDAKVNPDLDEGDPPWRSTGHRYLSRQVRWTPPAGGLLEPKPSVGTIVGWISAEDLDSEGNPGFLSSVSGEPANLFHAVFEDFVQDFEEFELEECLLDENGD